MAFLGLIKSEAEKQYRRYRIVYGKLANKIVESLDAADLLVDAATALGLRRGRAIVVESESDLSVIFDFLLYELPWQGKTLVQRYYETRRPSDPVEQLLLAGMVTARTGLYQVEAVDKSHNHVLLQDVGEKGRRITLTDINFSRTVVPGALLFFRAIQLPALLMTSGSVFAFPEDAYDSLTKRYRRAWSNANSASRFVAMFKLNRRIGVQTFYAPVGP